MGGVSLLFVMEKRYTVFLFHMRYPVGESFDNLEECITYIDSIITFVDFKEIYDNIKGCAVNYNGKRVSSSDWRR
jgi:hypothetical protein